MIRKYTRAFLIAMFAAAPVFAATADLNLSLQNLDYSFNLVDPGAVVKYTFSAKNAGPDSVVARVTIKLPAGGHFVSVSDSRWQCAEESASIVCSRFMQAPTLYDDSFFDLRFTAPPDPQGVVADTTATIDSEATDPEPNDNGARSTLTVYHTIDVTAPDDAGPGTLRAAVEQANAECDATIPCKIRFADAMHIAPLTPLPAVTGCLVLIDGGVYDPNPATLPRNRFFDHARRVQIDGSHLAAGSGFTIAAHCSPGVGNVTLRGLAIGGFPENGVAVLPASDRTIGIEGCFIGTDATGTLAVPNALRGIATDAPVAELVVHDSLLAANLRSGLALYEIGKAEIRGNLIGVRFGGIPMPNGASGAYVGAGVVSFQGNAIEYNHEFGIAIRPGAAAVASEHDYIVANGGLAVDWNLDGPSNLPGLPPVPRITDAFYDAAGRSTVIRGTVPFTPPAAKGYYSVRAVLSAGDFEGGISLYDSPYLSTDNFGDVPFEIRVPGDYTGQRIDAQTTFHQFPDFPETNVSEYSASLIVR